MSEPILASDADRAEVVHAARTRDDVAAATAGLASPLPAPDAAIAPICDGLAPVLDGAVPLPAVSDVIGQLSAGGAPSSPVAPNLMPGSPLSLTDPGSQLRAPGTPAPQAPAAPAPGAPGPAAGSAPPAPPAPSSTPATPERESGGGLLGGLFGGGS